MNELYAIEHTHNVTCLSDPRFRGVTLVLELQAPWGVVMVENKMKVSVQSAQGLVLAWGYGNVVKQ